MKKFGAAALVLTIGVLTAHGAEENAKSPKEYAACFEDLLKAFDKADAKIFRIASNGQKPKAGENPQQVDQYPVLEQKALGKEDLDSLKALLVRPDTFSDQWARCFTPGLAFRLTQGEQTLELVVCLKCNYVKYSDGKKSERWPLSEKGNAALMTMYETYFKEAEKK